MNQSGGARRASGLMGCLPRIARGEPHIRSAAGKCVKGNARRMLAGSTTPHDDACAGACLHLDKDSVMLGTILLIVLILLLLGALPNWGYSRSWGYGPSGLLGILIVIIIVLWVLGRL
jgi:hypothetical protein